jgi:hypothetical protein
MNVDQQGESTTVDWQQYESDAHQAIAAASTAGELDDARVHYLGRKGDPPRRCALFATARAGCC